MTVLPAVGLTMGDPAGIGPELIVKALGEGGGVEAYCRPVVIGDARRLARAAELCSLPVEVASVASADERVPSGAVACLDLANVPPELPFGRLDAAAGQAAYEYVRRAVELAADGAIDAICTLPLNKKALHAAGHPYPGHTELLAELTGTREVSMMLDTGSFRVSHVTTHVGLLDAIELIEPGLVYRTIVRTHDALRRSGLERPAIAVCGINPHAGENGLFGRGEEEVKIAPAVAQARSDGIDALGPLPGDTVFFRAQRGDFDAVVAMYHDQGHGPVKVLGIDRGVNITIGLPVVRTSVDHGTAFDIAGTGRADVGSLLSALRAAAALASR
jgi:4-hydroxythreonine-4-phosphate dehydrogenase